MPEKLVTKETKAQNIGPDNQRWGQLQVAGDS